MFSIKHAVILLPVLTFSCAAPKPEVRPLMPVPEAFSRAGGTVLPDRWWLSFNDPDLNTLMERALTGNFTLRTAWDRLAQAEAVARQVGAQLWPWVDGSFQARRIRSKVAGREPEETMNATQLSLGAVASYEVDLWGRVRSIRDAAAFEALASQENLQAAAITLSAEVAATWYALVEQRGQVIVLRVQAKANQEVLEIITARFRGGQAGAADVLRQRQLVESTQGELILAQSRVGLMQNQLAILLGVPPNHLAAPDRAELPQPDPLPRTGVPAELVRNRPDIRQAYLQLMAADRRVAAAVADRFPRVGVSASLDTSGSEWRSLFNNWAGTLAANVLAPLFDAGLRKAEVVRTRAVVSEGLNRYGQTVLLALGEVENALLQEEHQREYLLSLEKQLDLSQRTIERIRDSYLAGAVRYLDILQALVSQQSLQRTELLARRQLLEYRVELCRALASSWEMSRPPPGTINQEAM